MVIDNHFIDLVKKLIIKKDIQKLGKTLNNFNINTSNTMLYTPLHLSILYGNEEIFELIINLNPQLETKTCIGKTALHLSIQQKNINIFKKLLTYKINAEIPTNKGVTPLHLAVYYQNEEAVETLLNYGVNPNVQTQKGYTALQWALIKTNINIIIKLLNHGAKADIKNRNTKNAFHYMDSDLQKKITQALVNEYKSVYQRYYENKIKVAMLFKVPQIMCLKADLESYFLIFLTPYTKKKTEYIKKIIQNSLKEINSDWLFLNQIEKEISEKILLIDKKITSQDTSEELLASTSQFYINSKEKNNTEEIHEIIENSTLEYILEEPAEIL